ncbi:site-specific DNA-methyltransferase [Patescibacteria group bacterium]|nr:site-specific DNA-methyltransferase [Patescibacteria group bacterium]
MQVQTIAINTIIPYEKNAKLHPAEQVIKVAASIKRFGWAQPLVVDKENNLIIGHCRLLAAKSLGFEEVPVVKMGSLSEKEIKALRLADNRLNESPWDMELVLPELRAMDTDLAELTGFSLDLLSDSSEVENNVPETPENPTTKTGDIWLLGKHRVMCGDSTSIEALEQLCGGQLVDMWLTDPPYNVAYEGGTKENLKIKNDEMGDEQFRQFLRDAYTAADTVMKPGAVFYIWYADVETYNFVGAVRYAGWKMSQILVWKKSSLILGRKDYHFQHEPCLYGWKEGAAHLWASDRKQTTILEFDKPSRNGEHPTMKPVALFEYQMLNNTKGGDIVLDSFGGSGTTLLAAEKNGRYARLMELDPKYCDVIIKRWEEFTGKKAKKYV